MNIVLQLPPESSYVINSIWSDCLDVDMFHAVFGLLLYDYYFVLRHNHVNPQLSIFETTAQVTQADIARELYNLNLSLCVDDLPQAEFVKAALEWYRVVTPYTDMVLSKYSYLELIDIIVDEHYDDVTGEMQTYLFIKFVQ